MGSSWQEEHIATVDLYFETDDNDNGFLSVNHAEGFVVPDFLDWLQDHMGEQVGLDSFAEDAKIKKNGFYQVTMAYEFDVYEPEEGGSGWVCRVLSSRAYDPEPENTAIMDLVAKVDSTRHFWRRHPETSLENALDRALEQFGVERKPSLRHNLNPTPPPGFDDGLLF